MVETLDVTSKISRRAFVTAAATGLAAVAIPPARAKVFPTVASKGEVFIVGDSLTLAMTPYLQRNVGSQGWSVRVDAMNNRKFAEGLKVLEANAWVLPSTVIVALGTNDMYAPLEHFGTWMTQARKICGFYRRLIFVNLFADDVLVPSRAVYRKVNVAMDDAALANAAEVADWAGYVHAQGVKTMYDGVHYDAANSEKRARFTGEVLAVPSLPLR